MIQCAKCEKEIQGGYMIKDGELVHYRCYYPEGMDNWEAGWGPKIDPREDILSSDG